MTAQTTTQRTAAHRRRGKERVEKMEQALRLALPWLSAPLDDRDMSAASVAYRAVADALKPNVK